MTDRETFVQSEVLDNRIVAQDHCEMALRISEPFPVPQPGQFVMVRSPGHREPLLARPLSVYGYEDEKGGGILHLLYRISGAGTRLLSGLLPGSPLSVLGPLGRGFRWMAEQRPVFIAGGVGVAPLAYLLETLTTQGGAKGMASPIFYLGAKTAMQLLARERLADRCDLRICTDDGSAGFHGLVTERFEEDLPQFTPSRTQLFACGPAPMVRSLCLVLNERAMSCQVSLEERMACGLGACLGCAVALRTASGALEYQRVCKDGPVFLLGQLVTGKGVQP